MQEVIVDGDLVRLSESCTLSPIATLFLPSSPSHVYLQPFNREILEYGFHFFETIRATANNGE